MSKPEDSFAAIADPTRRAILDLLRLEGPLAAGAIAARFPSISRVAVSKHVKVLREAGLVEGHASGREVLYTLDVRPLRAIQEDWLRRFAPLWDASLEALRRSVETSDAGGEEQGTGDSVAPPG